jgi:amino acid adenylation domain-containing protein
MDSARSWTPSVLGELIAHQASRRGDTPALTDGDRELTWHEYAEAATALAVALLAAGVEPGDRVAIVLPKSVDAFVAVHGVLRVGGVVVPVDWFAPPSYVADVIADAGAAVVVSAATGARLDALRAIHGVHSVVDPTAQRDARPATDPPAAAVAPDDPAYIVYTSGSTGRPKGIVHTHASALAYARRAVATYDLGPGDRLANIAPLHFDQSTFELYAAPLAGAAVLVVPDGVLRFPASVGELVERERITVWYSVPFAISQLVERGAIDERDLSSMRWVLFGGESFPPSALRTAMRQLPGARFSNVYGPAEVNQCTFHHLDDPPVGDESIPIGAPWEGAEVRVVTDGLRDVERGRVGELLVSTDTMMAEYWGRPDLTAAAIVTEAGSRAQTPVRWYRTGDLVRELDDGTLVFLGRVDHQVKVRGHRVELEAVELVLGEEPGVDAAAVVVDDDAAGLVALVEPEPDAATRRSITKRLRARLPNYAVPAELVGVASLPRTGTGKVDRRAAASLFAARRTAPEHGEAQSDRNH